MKKFPEKVNIFGADIYIREARLHGPLGRFECDTGTIWIEEDQRWEGKCIIFIHEMLHAVNELLIQNGFCKRHIDHRFIEGASPAILAFLIQAGLVTEMSIEDLLRFLQQTQRVHNPRGKKPRQR